jgi:hypothetical protein
MIWLRLLGVFGWLKNAALSALRLAGRHPWQAALIVAVRPPLPRKNPPNSRQMNLIFSGHLRPRHFPMHTTDFTSRFFGEFRTRMFFASNASTMHNLVGHVFFWRRPSKVKWVNASLVTFPAAMCRLMDARRRLPIFTFTYHACHRDSPAPIVHMGAAPFPDRVGPDQTVCSSKGHYDFIKESGFPMLGSDQAVKRPMPPNSFVMHIAQSMRLYFNRLVAFINRAYRYISHVAVLSRGGQGRALLTQRFRPDFYIRYAVSHQGVAAC